MTDATRRKWLGAALLTGGALQARHAVLVSDLLSRAASNTRVLAYFYLLWIPFTLALGLLLWSPWRNSGLARGVGAVWLGLSALAVLLQLVLGVGAVGALGGAGGAAPAYLSMLLNVLVCLMVLLDVRALLFAPFRRLCPYRLTVLTSMSLWVPCLVGLALAEAPAADWSVTGARFSGLPAWQGAVVAVGLLATGAAARHTRLARPAAWLLALALMALPYAAHAAGLPLDELLPTAAGLAYWLVYLGFNMRA